MLKNIPLFQGRSIEIVYNDKVFDPTKTSIDPIFVADMFLPAEGRVLDVGTGSGFIALALKRLNPKADVHAVDTDPEAVKQAKSNAKGLKLKIEVWEGYLAEGRQDFDMVVANLPTYNDEDIENETLYGPHGAYFVHATDRLYLYKELFKQLPDVLKEDGIFVCELRKDLHEKLLKYAEKQGWKPIMETDASLAFVKK
jgi:release factor glutamine methyltransferase